LFRALCGPLPINIVQQQAGQRLKKRIREYGGLVHKRKLNLSLRRGGFFAALRLRAIGWLSSYDASD
jgi:hypothetical protein